jgi:hypothetical protein
MPRYKPAHTFIELRISDLVPGVIARLARFRAFAHDQAPNGVCSVGAKVWVTLVRLVDGELGPPYENKATQEYEVSLVGDNNTIVDAATGEILLIKTTQDVPEWDDIAEAYPQMVMYQGDFFELVRKHSPLDLEEMIEQNIRQADAMGRFD